MSPVTSKQVATVHISAALESSAPRVVHLQAGCSYSNLTLDEVVQLRDALNETIREIGAAKATSPVGGSR